jgi:capsular exopolysaccharide synthesis family protein
MKGYGYGYGLATGYGRRRHAKTPTGPAEKPREAVAIELLPHNLPRSSAAEAYRALRTSLLLSRPGGVKSMVVSSAFPGEGKTSTAVNLAVVLGQLPGKGVLVVDADLHKPRLHEVFGVSNRTGLVSVLAQNVPGSAAIVKTSIPGVFVVPAGPASPNPSGLLASEAMRDLLTLAMTSFEYVVVDAPPIFPVADALVLGAATDGVIICTKGGGTPREHVIRLRDMLVQSNVPILGVVLNRLSPKAHPYGHRYFAYYEDSAYGSSAEKGRASGSASG